MNGAGPHPGGPPTGPPGAQPPPGQAQGLSRYPQPGQAQGFQTGAPPTGGPPPPMGAPPGQMPPGQMPPGQTPYGQTPYGQTPYGGRPGYAPSPPGGPAGAPPPAAPGGASAPRIDPAQIPRPPHDAHASVVRHDTRSDRGGATHPPPASTTFCARDLGNCNPRYMRSTLSTIPHSADLLSQSGMPLTLLVQPLALPHPEEEPIQVVEHADGVGPVRCGRCKAYMNPYNRWLDHGRFSCVFCAHTTEAPREYMCPLGADGRRTDLAERPELHKGSVEYAAPGEYMVRPPMAPALFFLVDVNPVAVQTGATTSACEAILRTLDAIPERARTLVGLCAFDSACHFFKFPGSASSGSTTHGDRDVATTTTTKHLVVPDVEEPYAPLPSGLAVPLEANRADIAAALRQIPEMFASGRHGLPCGAAAIKACVEALKPTGGRVLAFVATMPTGGYGAVKGRTAVGTAMSKETEKEPVKHAAPADKVYSKMATEAAEYQCAIDAFLLSNGHVDVASLGHLCRVTGGSLYRYHDFNTALDFAQLHNDLRWNVARPQGLEAVMRVRASAGLGVADYGGFFCKRTPTDVDLPALDCDKAISVDLRYEEKLADGQDAFAQCALLYTTMRGERRIRVHTLALPVSSVLGNVFRASDLEAQTCDMIRRASAKLLAGTCSLQGAKDGALRTTVDTLHAYRKFCASNNSTGQLILPEGLKVLPLYCLALHKSDGLRFDASADDRAEWALRGVSCTASSAVPSIYPRHFPVHALRDDLQTNEYPPLPATTWLSAEKLEQDGSYLLEDGREMYLWVGRATSREALRETFGVEHVDALGTASHSVVPRLDTNANKSLNALIDALRRMRSSYMRLRVLRRGDARENAYYRRLIEDRSPAGQSYVEFLCHVHRLIQNKFQ